MTDAAGPGERHDLRDRVREVRATLPPCPKCGSLDVAPIVYGLPVFSPDLVAAVEAKELTLGGCMPAPENVACLSCRTTFESPTLEATTEGE